MAMLAVVGCAMMTEVMSSAGAPAPLSSPQHPGWSVPGVPLAINIRS